MYSDIQYVQGLEEYQEIVLHYPSIVKFTADWCGPCKKSTPLYSSMAKLFSDRVAFLEIDIDNIRTKKIVVSESVQSVPLTLFYKNGILANSISGFNQELMENRIRAFVDEVNLDNLLKQVEAIVVDKQEVVDTLPEIPFTEDYLLKMLGSDVKQEVSTFLPGSLGEIMLTTFNKVFKQMVNIGVPEVKDEDITEDFNILTKLTEGMVGTIGTTKPDNEVKAELLRKTLEDMFNKSISKGLAEYQRRTVPEVVVPEMLITEEVIPKVVIPEILVTEEVTPKVPSPKVLTPRILLTEEVTPKTPRDTKLEVHSP